MTIRTLTPLVAALSALALTACSGGGEEELPEPAPEATTEPVTLEAMPEAFQGRWDFAEEDCAAPASEMRLVVGPNHVDFYESGADLSAITRTGDGVVTAEHAFSGEGESWEERLAYELNADGDRLTVTSPDGSMSVRMRCP